MIVTLVAIVIAALVVGPFFASPRDINKRSFELHRGKPRDR